MELKLSDRIWSILIDQFIIWIISGSIWMSMFFANDMNPTHDYVNIAPLGDFLLIFVFYFSIWTIKDSFNGRSIGKRIMRLQVVQSETNLAASPLRCFVRNLSLLLWPIEMIVILVRPGRRMGDFIANTKIVDYNRGV